MPKTLVPEEKKKNKIKYHFDVTQKHIAYDSVCLRVNNQPVITHYIVVTNQS